MDYLGTPDYQHGTPAPLGVLLTNVGTPAAPTARALRPYLRQFLGDRRIVELPRWLWQPLLRGILLNTRPRKSAKLYQRVWTADGSPLLVILQRQAAALQATLDAALPVPVRVAGGMSYGEPSIGGALRTLHAAHVRRLLVLPLFPQYSATTTAASLDCVFDELKRWRWIPDLRTVNQYHDDAAYITAVADSIRAQWVQSGRPQRLLFSFHGIPQNYFLAGDPYYCQCQKTARLIAEQLALPAEQWAVSFQSRLGPFEWLRPYTDQTLAAWGAEGLQHVDAVCPGFSADCLETTDEVGHEGKHAFQSAGGGVFHYIDALNDRPDHIAALVGIVTRALQGWLEPAAPADAQQAQRVAAQRAALGLPAGR